MIQIAVTNITWLMTISSLIAFALLAMEKTFHFASHDVIEVSLRCNVMMLVYDFSKMFIENVLITYVKESKYHWETINNFWYSSKLHKLQ